MSTIKTPLEKVEKVLGKHFSIVKRKDITHFPCLGGKIVRLVINHQGKHLALFVAETHNDIIVRLFDSSRPEKYFTEIDWVPGSAVRSNNPFIFNWKALYENPQKKQWVDAQLPMHALPLETLSVFFKMFPACEDIAKELM